MQFPVLDFGLDHFSALQLCTGNCNFTI